MGSWARHFRRRRRDSLLRPLSSSCSSSSSTLVGIMGMERIAWKKQRDDTLASKAKLSSAYRTGVMVLLWLAFLTAIEFVANMIGASTVAMFLIAFIKAAIILQFFMHVSSLWLEGESH